MRIVSRKPNFHKIKLNPHKGGLSSVGKNPCKGGSCAVAAATAVWRCWPFVIKGTDGGGGSGVGGVHVDVVPVPIS